MQRIAIDIFGPLRLTKKRNKYISVIQDYFTEWAKTFPIKDQEASTITNK